MKWMSVRLPPPPPAPPNLVTSIYEVDVSVSAPSPPSHIWLVNHCSQAYPGVCSSSSVAWAPSGPLREWVWP